ncbi:MAG: Ig-like domain-containing protein [Cyanobium sp.]
MAAPVLQDIIVNGTTLTLHYDVNLSSTIPSKNRFVVTINGRKIGVTAASLVNSNSIQLTLAEPVQAEQVVTLSYIKLNSISGSANITEASTGDTAAFFKDSAVINQTPGSAVNLLITSNKALLKSGDTAIITFTFSDVPLGFTASDITVVGGQLTGLAVTGDIKVYTATFTPTPNSNGTATIAVAAGSYTNAGGTSGNAGTSPAIGYDTLPPALQISSNRSAFKAGESATITFTFTEVPIGFTAADLVVSGGSVTNLFVTANNKVYTATFTPTPNSSGTASITVAAGSYTDAAGNPGGAGTTPVLAYDTLAPTLVITSSSAALSVGQTATITFTFSEDPGNSFSWDGTTGDVTVSGGTLSSISGSGLTRTATFTPAPNSSGTASITAAAGSYTDAAGNPGGAGTTPALT